MSRPAIPDGWEWEPADPSVGIMGETWWHCGETDEGVEAVTTNYDYRGTGANRVIVCEFSVTCPRCGAVGTGTREDWDPEPPDDPLLR